MGIRWNAAVRSSFYSWLLAAWCGAGILVAPTRAADEVALPDNLARSAVAAATSEHNALVLGQVRHRRQDSAAGQRGGGLECRLVRAEGQDRRRGGFHARLGPAGRRRRDRLFRPHVLVHAGMFQGLRSLPGRRNSACGQRDPGDDPRPAADCGLACQSAEDHDQVPELLRRHEPRGGRDHGVRSAAVAQASRPAAPLVRRGRNRGRRPGHARRAPRTDRLDAKDARSGLCRRRTNIWRGSRRWDRGTTTKPNKNWPACSATYCCSTSTGCW